MSANTAVRARPSDSTPVAPTDPILFRSILAATILAALLRLYHLGAQSLWIDELFTRAAAEVGGRMSVARLLEDVHGPLYSLAVHLWSRVAGDHEWALRFPSALAGILAVPVMARLAERWFGRDAAIPAAWLAAASPFLVWYGQEARNYSWLILFSALAASLLLELRERATAAGLARYLAAAGAAGLSNLSFALVLPLHVRWGLGALGRGRRAALAAAVIVVALALVALPWLPQITRTWDWSRLAPGRRMAAVPTAEAPLRGTTTFHVAAIPFALHAFAVGYTLGPSLQELRVSPSGATLRRHLPELTAVGLLFVWLGLVGLSALARRRRLVDTLVWLVVPALIVSYFAGQNFKVFHPRYLAVSYPGFLLVLAAAFASLKGWTRAGAVSAVALVWGSSLGLYYFDPAYGREDYRGALARVAAGARTGEQIVAVGSPEPVEYYARGTLPVGRFWLGFAADTAKMEAKLEERFAQASGSWVVLSRAEDLDPEGRFARRMDRAAGPDARWSVHGVRVWHVTTERDRAATP